MDDVIALFKFAEIDVERRTHPDGVRRFHAARSLHFVAAEDFGVGNDNKFAVVKKKTSRQGAQMQRRAGLLPTPARGLNMGGLYFLGESLLRVPTRQAGPVLRSRTAEGGRLPYVAEAVFLPDFVKPLPLSVVVAIDVNGVVLAQPAMQLGEEFAALGFGNLRFRRAVAERAESIERREW